MGTPVGIAEAFVEGFVKKEVDESLKLCGGGSGSEGDIKITTRFKVPEGLFSSVEMSWGRIMLMLCKKGYSGGNIGVSSAAKPIKGTNNRTQLGFKTLAVSR